MQNSFTAYWMPQSKFREWSLPRLRIRVRWPVFNRLAAESGPASDAVIVPTSISADYFKTLQTRLVGGRFFDESDRSGAPRVAIINQTLAGILFPNRNPVGRRIKFGDDADPWVTVVGVVADIHHRGLGDRNWPEIFQTYEQTPAYWMTLLVKTSGDPLSLAPALRKDCIHRSQAAAICDSIARGA